MKLSSDQPIQIESNKLEIHDQEHTALFTGDVKVVQGTTTLQAGKMTVYYKDKAKQPQAAGGATPAAQPAAEQSNSLASGSADIDKILVTESRRDAELNETDSIQIVLDTFNDNQNAFLFGTNPVGLEYDGQVAAEGQTGGFSSTAGAAGSQRGGVSGYNPNWDGDWTVRSQITERGWETEMAIPLKTLRYEPGEGV